MATIETRTFTVGDRVRRSAYFLKNIATHPCDDIWREWGTVVEVKVRPSGTYLEVLWDDEGDKRPRLILSDNVMKRGELSRRTAVI